MSEQSNITESAHSEKVTALIRDEIKATGPISFARFMELALYAPGLGYYAAGAKKLGRQGDFVTAPEISSLFSMCLANKCSEVLSAIPKGSVLELGAGSGAIATLVCFGAIGIKNLVKEFRELPTGGGADFY